jgi:hypothetical protein
VLRFWESRFPQIKPVKRAGGRRFYRPEDVDLLRGIRRRGRWSDQQRAAPLVGARADPRRFLPAPLTAARGDEHREPAGDSTSRLTRLSSFAMGNDDSDVTRS